VLCAQDEIQRASIAQSSADESNWFSLTICLNAVKVVVSLICDLLMHSCIHLTQAQSRHNLRETPSRSGLGSEPPERLQVLPAVEAFDRQEASTLSKQIQLHQTANLQE
jgi:hypothetical protein